jgi:hypothetical protein
LLLTAAIPLFACLAVAASAQESAPYAQPAASTGTTDVTVTVNTLTDRHPISPYIYGANFPPSKSYITTGGVTLSRWGGDATSRYNWKLNAMNDNHDWYFENYSWGTPDSSQFVSTAVAAGSAPIMTIPMLTWVAKDTVSWSFSVSKYGAQCGVNPYNSDAGDGVLPDCSTNLTGNDPTDANTRLFDKPSPSDPEGSVYRNQWIESIAPHFGKQPHFYQLDNEPELWGTSHRDVHPDATGYDELAADIVAEGEAVKTFDPAAVRFAPVDDSWWFYWNGADNNDKAAHGGLDLLPWILNEIRWNDEINGSRSFDIFDVHAYFNGPGPQSTTALTRAAALRETRDWWDPAYISESGTVNQIWCTVLQPDRTVGFVIPRMRALANSIYPGTPVSFTEWNGALAGESDFSTALVDADTYGILGRERMWGASRWVAADATTPAYQALVLYRNADGAQHGFETVSVSATSSASPNLFAAYAATDEAGETLTLMVINKDPANQARVTFMVDNFTPSTMKTYTLSEANPTKIVASAAEPWSATQTFAPYSATLIVASGRSVDAVAEEWDLNPDTLLAPTSGTVTIAPTLTKGTGTVTLTEASGTDYGVKLTLTQPKITQATATSTGDGLITIKTPSHAGIYSFTVTGRDSGGTVQTQHGWVLATLPAATLTKTGDRQTASPGAKITLTATYKPGNPPAYSTGPQGPTAGGVDLFFTASAGTLSERIVRTNANGQATVTLTLPEKAGKVTVTAVGPVFWGTPTATFTETVQ